MMAAISRISYCFVSREETRPEARSKPTASIIYWIKYGTCQCHLSLITKRCLRGALLMCCGRTSSNVNCKRRRLSGFKSKNDWSNISAFSNNRLQLDRKCEPLMFRLMSSFSQLLLEESVLVALPDCGEWSDAWLVRELLYDGPYLQARTPCWVAPSSVVPSR